MSERRGSNVEPVPDIPEEDDVITVDLPMNYTNMPSSRTHPENVTPESDSNNSEIDLTKVFTDLCNACRSGDIDVVDSLLSTPNLDINQVDEWDYSPLILSSLCGHLKIVELLLSRGAVCDRDTFQGARCIYGALNDTIRDLLISFDVSKAVDTSQPFASHIASLLGPLNYFPTKDIVFHFPHVNGVLARDFKSFRLNRFLLAARSPYFREKLDGSWKYKPYVDMPSSSDPTAFKVVVDYIYLRTDSLPIDQLSIQDQLAQFAFKLKLTDLAESIEKIRGVQNDKERAKIKHDASYKFVEKARKDFDDFLKNSVFANHYASDLNLAEEVELEDIDASSYITEEQKLKLLDSSSIPDVILASVDSESETVVFYPANKSVIARSEYFDTMFKSDIFASSQQELPMYKDYQKTANIEIIDRGAVMPEHLPVIQISTSTSSKEVAQMVLSFLYHDDIAHIPLSSTVELLYAADELFLERLKTMCAVNITSNFNKFTVEEFKQLSASVGYNAYELIRVSWSARCDKLEQHVTKMMAHNLSYIFETKAERENLLSLISESAARINQRQDTDTIELIDDIRYYLSKKYSVNDEFADFDPLGEQFREFDTEFVESEDIRVMKNALLKYDRDIEMIDDLLDRLELAA